jgi:hypothetical protein
MAVTNNPIPTAGSMTLSHGITRIVDPGTQGITTSYQPPAVWPNPDTTQPPANAGQGL